MDIRGCLLTASLTANAVSVLCLMVSVILRVMVRWRRCRLSGVSVAPSQPEEFIHKYKGQLSSMLVDSLVALGLFIGGLYLLIGAKAVSRPFSAGENHSENFHTATILFSIGIGRLGVAFVMGVRRMRTIVSPLSASMSIMQCVDHLVSLVSLILIVIHQEDILTGAMLLIMSIDNNVFTLNTLLDRLPSAGLDGLRLGFRVFQCFLSIAFRCAVPLVCTVVSLVVYRRNVLQMKPQSLAIFISAGIFYLAYNSWVIVHAVRALWHACGGYNRPEKCAATEKNAFFANNPQGTKDRTVPLSFTVTKENCDKTRGPCRPLCSFTDLDCYLDENIPPPYENYRRLPRRSQFFRPSLHVSANQGTVSPPPAPQEKINITGNTLNKNVNLNDLSIQGQKPQRSKLTRKPTIIPFAANLPTIDEENKDGFTDISF